MQILAIETTGQFCSIALLDAKGKVSEKISYEKLNHLKTLAGMIDEILREAKMSTSELDAIAVSEGPGSFTGIRIGVSTARALSQVSGTPCITVPTLYAFAKRYDIGTFVCPIFDARRNQVFATLCKDGETIMKAGAYDIGELVQKIILKIEEKASCTTKPFNDEMPKLIFVGDGIKKYGEVIAEALKAASVDAKENKDIEISFEVDSYQKATDVLGVAVSKYKKGETVAFEDLKPQYMRKSEAQRNLEERLKKEL